jgi:hypothetical protein
MLFCQLGQAKSLREICGGLAASDGECRSGVLPVAKCPALAGSRSGKQRKFRFKSKLLSLHATVIDLCASLFGWTRFRQTKGAVLYFQQG